MEYVVLGAVVAILILIFSSFRPAATADLGNGFYVINCLFVNFYLLKTDKGLILFDCGTGAMLARKGIKKLGLDSDDVTHIFLTHSDRDHAGGLAINKGAQVYLSSEEEQMINGQTPKKLFIHNKKLKVNYQLLENNAILEIDGITISILVTPGHTTGSAVYVIDEKVYVTGDLLRITRKDKVQPFLRLMDMNHKQSEKSLKEIEDVLDEAKMILSGHTGVFFKD